MFFFKKTLFDLFSQVFLVCFRIFWLFYSGTSCTRKQAPARQVVKHCSFFCSSSGPPPSTFVETRISPAVARQPGCYQRQRVHTHNPLVIFPTSSL